MRHILGSPDSFAPRRQGARALFTYLAGFVVVIAGILGGCDGDSSELIGGPGLGPPGAGQGPGPGSGTNPPGTPPGVPPGATSLESAAACGACHAAIFGQWSGSMHARAATSPVVVAQTHQVVKGPLAGARAPDPARFCVNCHAPSAAAATQSATFPLTGSPLAHEGITCVTCHKFNGPPVSGGGGLASSFQAGLQPGARVFGAMASPVLTRAHASGAWDEIKDPSDLCASCHDVNLDRDGDGKILKGTDLVLQTTAREYARYRSDGGTKTCVGCHMPSLAPGRAADSARIPEDQATDAPARALHDHGFVGVDAPLDSPQADTQAKARAELLRGAASISIDSSAAFGGTVDLDVSITNTGAGHNLPTGFAFARQMWLEIVVRRASGALYDASGALANEASDLCDASTYDGERAMRPYFVGCSAADPQLVNFQQKLVDRVDVLRGADGAPLLDDLGDPRLLQHASGLETWLQHLPGGAVPRVRPSDRQALGPIPAGGTRKFSYTMRGLIASGEEVKISARLLFRALPPYFLRALAASQPPGEAPRMSELPPRLQIYQMASATASARRQ